MKCFLFCAAMVLSLTAFSQTHVAGNWAVGDKIEVQWTPHDAWEKALISEVYSDWNPKRWKAIPDNANSRIAGNMLVAEQIRSAGANANAKTYLVGDKVDVYRSNGTANKRGCIKEVLGSGKYKVRYDGSTYYADDTVDGSQLQTAATVSVTDPDIQALRGKWAVFIYSYPNSYTDGTNIYRQYGTGAKAPPLLINADGTYTWYDVYQKPPVKGSWTTHAKFPGAVDTPDLSNGIVIKDSKGELWKVYRDKADHIQVRMMCHGDTKGGTKIN
jgi:hypothetical protein